MQTTRNVLVKFGPKLAAGTALVSPFFARAAVDADVSQAIANIGVDGSSIAKVVLLAVVAIFAIKFLRKAL